MDGVAAHTFGAGNQFQVGELDVLFVSIAKAQAVPGRHRTVVLLPKQRVNSDPISWWVAGISYLPLLIPLFTEAKTADRQPVARLRSLLELGLWHAPRGRQSFNPCVPGLLPLLEAKLHARVVFAAKATGVLAGQMRFAALEAHARGLSVDGMIRTAKYFD